MNLELNGEKDFLAPNLEKGTPYWFIKTYKYKGEPKSVIMDSVWNDDITDNENRIYHNVYLTKEDAKKELEIRKNKKQDNFVECFIKCLNEAEEIEGTDLDKIWIINEFTDSHYTEDGREDVEYTKIGLIDYLNDILEDMEEEQIPYSISDKDLKDYLEYLGTDAQLVEIK